MRLRGARTNNLKNIDLDIPLKKFTVITGVSGSGKSSLAFDTLYAEGQRRYVESLSTYTRQFLEQMPRPDIDSLDNVSPSIALEQKNHINNSRSTVATMSELYDCFRLLFSKAGHTYCLSCGELVRSDDSASIARSLRGTSVNTRFYILAPLDIKNKKLWGEVRKSLIVAGFERLALTANGKDKGPELEIAELSALEKFPAKAGKLYLVIDRMAMPEHPDQDQRLIDALDQAFQRGTGDVTLALKDAAATGGWVFKRFSDKFRCEACAIDYRVPEPQHFSFNSPLGACPTCSGFGFNLEVDENLVVPDFRKTLRNGAVDPFTKPAYQEWHRDLMKFCEKHGISTGKRYDDLTQAEKKLIWDGDGSKRGFPGIRGCFEELKEWRYKLYVRVFIRRYQSQVICPDCRSSRLRKEVGAIRLRRLASDGKTRADLNIQAVLELSVEKALEYFKTLTLSKTDAAIARDVLKQIEGRLQFMADVGVGYLTLNRLGKTLSGGECQRINLATQLGNKLCSTFYVLDEPSIGLHAADTEKLIALVHRLRDHGNTLVVVEHDLDVIRSADHIVELGPLAGARGGEVVAHGDLSTVLRSAGCLTAKYLSGVFSIPKRDFRRGPAQHVLKITGACENNLKDVSAEFPLGRLIAVTGLSGSGKTTLIHGTLYNALARLYRRENLAVGRFHRLYGADLLRDVVLLDQKPIGRSARSNPATYLKIWEEVRKIYSNQSSALRLGFTPAHFSFNVDGGRCPVCKGEGAVTVDMHFMADLRLPCEECGGKKFKREVLTVEFKGKNVDELLHTTVEECQALFKDYPAISSKLKVLQEVGLGYLELGQSGTTLSGGESQRLKVASVINDRSSTNVLYIFDEPTTGLHIDDTKRLLGVLQDLVDRQNTVIVIEHNLDLIAQADWVVDLGPGGGEHGGRVVATGAPEDLVLNEESLTGKYLKKVLA